jgi:hypothetical protein
VRGTERNAHPRAPIGRRMITHYTPLTTAICLTSLVSICLIPRSACLVRSSFSVRVVLIDLCEKLGNRQIDRGVGDL